MERRNHHRALLALLNVPELGLQRIRHLMRACGSGNSMEIFSWSPSRLMRIEGIGEQVARNIAGFNSWARIDRILDNTKKCRAGLLAFDDPEYPSMLRQIYDPPILLWYKGDLNLFEIPGVAVIGTRRPGSYGLNQTEIWVKELVKSGICINSGLAYGVDAKAHRVALDQGGATIGVLGSGIDVIYPARNSHIAAEMIGGRGLLLSEFPPGTKPDAVNFPARNRIVSGLSHGVLVVESGIKGGSMITARNALDQNREVFVVPHQLGYLKGEGCNYLIQTGQGKLITSIEDIMEELPQALSGESGPVQPADKPVITISLSPEEKALCDLLAEPLHLEQICEKLQKPSFALLPLMLELEMKGVIRQKAGKYFELCSPVSA
ncbi:MAG: DNA-processing protein DprA [Balneolaceae bacterium]|nr:DNA-processing protein DprA [Balneolaceae bacterium]MCH8547237.1 DNA-processing protein DprA [Balneolaceae bacterium]